MRRLVDLIGYLKLGEALFHWNLYAANAVLSSPHDIKTINSNDPERERA
jgi:hypothetical protein